MDDYLDRVMREVKQTQQNAAEAQARANEFNQNVKAAKAKIEETERQVEYYKAKAKENLTIMVAQLARQMGANPCVVNQF